MNRTRRPSLLSSQHSGRKKALLFFYGPIKVVLRAAGFRWLTGLKAGRHKKTRRIRSNHERKRQYESVRPQAFLYIKKDVRRKKWELELSDDFSARKEVQHCRTFFSTTKSSRRDINGQEIKDEWKEHLSLMSTNFNFVKILKLHFG